MADRKRRDPLLGVPSPMVVKRLLLEQGIEIERFIILIRLGTRVAEDTLLV